MEFDLGCESVRGDERGLVGRCVMTGVRYWLGIVNV